MSSFPLWKKTKQHLPTHRLLWFQLPSMQRKCVSLCLFTFLSEWLSTCIFNWLSMLTREVEHLRCFLSFFFFFNKLCLTHTSLAFVSAPNISSSCFLFPPLKHFSPVTDGRYFCYLRWSPVTSGHLFAPFGCCPALSLSSFHFSYLSSFMPGPTNTPPPPLLLSLLLSHV